ncbi:MAG: endonuclease III [Robiginitomaculum sp.]|nr:endonuclease III [Robiginitomaculum sp.]
MAKLKLPRPKLTRVKIAEMFERWQKMDPEPETELNYHNPYTLVVAVALSAQATDVGVNKATKALFAAADTPEKMLEIGEERLRDYIKTIGLYKTKAKNVIGLSQRLVDVYGSRVPDNRTDLESLPGVGRKTANVVLNVAYGQPTMAVDTHIFRVGNRTGMAPGKNPLQVELNLLKVIPEQYAVHAHHWLILHGRYTCKARKPMCQNCVIEDICTYKDKTKPVD